MRDPAVPAGLASEMNSPAMEGEGFYNTHSPQQLEVADFLLDVLHRALASLPPAVTATTIADYGASQGANSVHPIGEVIAALKARTDRDLTVVHTDLPSNDWATLFATVYGVTTGYPTESTGVYPQVVGRSFYHQLLPTGSVAVGWSSTAVLWLSRRPAVGPGNLFSYLAHGDDQQRWAHAAAADWRTFLGHRARELASGGRLVVSALIDDGVDRYGPFLGLIRSGVLDAVAAGAVTEEEASAMTVNTYLRTREEIEAPLRDDSIPLTILEHRIGIAPDPAFSSYRTHRDADRFAADQIAQIRGWAGPSLTDGLHANRTPARRRAAIDAIFHCIGARVAADPERGHCDWAINALAVAAP